jgi:K+-sensing histidine kinase KdpD
MRTFALDDRFSLDDRAAVFAFRGVLCLAMVVMLVHSPLLEETFRFVPFALAAFYMFTSFVLWRARGPRLQSPSAQALAYLWDVAVVSSLLYCSEGFDNELYLMYFLIMFMTGLMSQVRQSFLIGSVSSLIYAALWSQGKVGASLPLTNLLLRFAFFYVIAFFTAVMAERVRSGEKKVRGLEVRLALGRIANGGWGVQVDEDDAALDPELLKTVRTLNAVIDNLERALKRTVDQNEKLRESADEALLHLARQKETLGAVAEPKDNATPP